MTAPVQNNARFVSGSIARHVIVMTLTGAIGLMAVFLVDFADLYFLALLGVTEITAAIGYAGMVAFASMSVNIGIGIAGSALISRSLGAGRRKRAQKFATSTLFVAATVSLLTALIAFVFSHHILTGLGAHGAALGYGDVYIKTIAFGLPLLGTGLATSFILRAIGDARRAMYVTLAAALTNAVLDPVFIFGLDLSIQGAALATISANLIAFMIGIYNLVWVHKFPARPAFSFIRKDLAAIAAIALPASTTQLATPFAIGYMTWASSFFGDEAVAGTAIVNRLVPVAFGIVFSLSGAVGPIIGQNFGARNFLRLRETVNKAMLFNLVYIACVSVLLFVLRHEIPGWFKAKGDAVVLIVLFCTWIAATWVFAGAQFIAQAAFNTLGKPVWSMWLNWGKATIGTIPFIYFATKLWGFTGIIIGYGMGTVVFGILSSIAIYTYIGKLEHENAARPAN